MKWTKERLKNAAIAPFKATYKAIPSTEEQRQIKKEHPELFEFEAISVGDEDGQAFIVPLDESCKEVAEIIVELLKNETN